MRTDPEPAPRAGIAGPLRDAGEAFIMKLQDERDEKVKGVAVAAILLGIAILAGAVFGSWRVFLGVFGCTLAVMGILTFGQIETRKKARTK